MQLETTIITILALLLLVITFYLVKSKENYTTYLITPDLITETPVDIGYWRLGYGQPLPYEDISGYSPMLEQQENFVGAESEQRIGTCLDDNLQPLEGYPKHGFEPVCEMTFPKEKAPKIMGLDIIGSPESNGHGVRIPRSPESVQSIPRRKGKKFYPDIKW